MWGTTIREAQSEAKAPLSFQEILKDLGWFTALFSTLVGGPSILSLFQVVFVDHRLIDAFQWVVDGYNDITMVIGAKLEPLIEPAISWLNGVLALDLILQPHWRAVFVLMSVMVIGYARRIWRDGEPVAAALFGIGASAGALVGAVAAGLASLVAVWWAQALIAAAPLAALCLTFGIAVSIYKLLHNRLGPTWEDIGFMFGGTMGLGWIACALVYGAAMSRDPDMGAGAGVVVLGFLFFVIGMMSVVVGVAKSDRSAARFGLIILGGFLTAGLILLADAAVKVLT
ncbi:MAG TPA: hypothetical protein DHW63_03120 [Hyphomonadaceae bacterium]|nr:hypothetical protein [Hyphomonadaceae bacterium]